MRALLLILAGCWTSSSVPEAPPAPSSAGATAVNARFRIAEVRAIRKCSANGPQMLLLSFRDDAESFEIELAHAPGDAIPKTVADGVQATFSPCHSHGCDVAMLTLDELVIGKRARGRYRVSAKAGPQYADEFEATWVGRPWAVECPSENI